MFRRKYKIKEKLTKVINIQIKSIFNLEEAENWTIQMVEQQDSISSARWPMQILAVKNVWEVF